MRTQTELTSKNSVKLKQYCYFHAEFLEEIRYAHLISDDNMHATILSKFANQYH